GSGPLSTNDWRWDEFRLWRDKLCDTTRRIHSGTSGPHDAIHGRIDSEGEPPCAIDAHAKTIFIFETHQTVWPRTQWHSPIHAECVHVSNAHVSIRCTCPLRGVDACERKRAERVCI